MDDVRFHLVLCTHPAWSSVRPSTYSTLPGEGHALYQPLRWSSHCSIASALANVEPGQPTNHAAPLHTMKSTIDASMYEGADALRAPRCQALPSVVRIRLAPQLVVFWSRTRASSLLIAKPTATKMPRVRRTSGCASRPAK
eukprot:2483661-Prymnesium_polylepis.1